MAWSLRLVEHDLAAGEALALPAGLRVLFAAEGGAVVTSSAGDQHVGPQAAWHGAGPCAVAAEAPTRLLRFELVSQPPPALGGGRASLEHPIALDPAAPWLMRCDRVDFAPGGVALPHRHRGGGIRRLLRGALTVTVGEMAPRLMRPGDPWFESGREPVLAVGAAGEETSFVRASILPADIRGRSSILYVDPADAERGRPRAYTVLVARSTGIWKAQLTCSPRCRRRLSSRNCKQSRLSLRNADDQGRPIKVNAKRRHASGAVASGVAICVPVHRPVICRRTHIRQSEACSRRCGWSVTAE